MKRVTQLGFPLEKLNTQISIHIQHVLSIKLIYSNCQNDKICTFLIILWEYFYLLALYCRDFYKLNWSMGYWIRGFKHYMHATINGKIVFR